MKIKDEILTILSNCRVEQDKIFLPNTQLERKIYLKTNEALESIGGKWNRKEKCHIFSENIEEKFEDMILTGEFTDKKRELNYFPTPLNIVKQMIELAELKENDSVMEPCAGQGAIVDEIYKVAKKCNVVLFEIDKNNCDILRKKGYKVSEVDFLTFRCSPEFLNVDKVIQNPPFHIKNNPQCDIDFIYYSWKFIKNNGILVSIVSESPFFRENNKSIKFCEWLLKNNAEIIKLPDNSFAESGTNVRTRIIKVKKL